MIRLVYRWLKNCSMRFLFFFDAIGCFFSRTPREKMLITAMEFVLFNKVEGDYLEFGVFEGMSFITAFRFAQKNNLKQMKFYAFDSFQGLPDIEEIDKTKYKHFSKGNYACSLETFRKILVKQGVDLNKVKIVPGWFDETLNKETKKKIALKSAAVVFIDCNLYKSTIPVLNFIKDCLVDGSIIIFDDWFCFRGSPDRGEQKAFREWLMKHPDIKVTQFRKFGWFGNSFIIHKRKKDKTPHKIQK